MMQDNYLPRGPILLKSLRLTTDRLNGDFKLTVSSAVLAELLRNVISTLPFDEAIYLSRNDDIRAAHEAGEIANLHDHFVEAGFFEGRIASKNVVDADWYVARYPDVYDAIKNQAVRDAETHYIANGAAEGRVPNQDVEVIAERWNKILGLI